MIRWCLAGVLLLLFLWVAAMNASVFWTQYIRKRKASSWIPLLGGLCGLLGIIALPLPASNRWCWIPLLLDWGSIPGMVDTVLFHRQMQKKDRGNVGV